MRIFVCGNSPSLLKMRVILMFITVIILVIVYTIGFKIGGKIDYTNDVGLSIITNKSGKSWVEAFNHKTGESYSFSYVTINDNKLCFFTPNAGEGDLK